MKPIFKIFGLVALLALIFYMSVFAATSDLQKQIDEKNKEIQKLEQEIKQYQDSIDEAEETAKTLKGAISKINAEIKKLSAQINLTQKKISAKELEIKNLGVNISDLEVSIAGRKQNLAALLEELNNVENTEQIQQFFKYKTLSEFFGELEKIKSLSKNIQELHTNLLALKVELESKKADAESAHNELKRLKSQLTTEKFIEEGSRAEKSELLKITKNQEVAYQKLLRDREKKRADIYEEIRSIEEELRKQIDFGSLPKGKGILFSPIDGGVLTQEFGQTAFAQYTDVYKNGFHNGVDLRALVGTPVRSAAQGVVKAIGNTDTVCPRGSYGKWVLVEHPNNLTTLYAHLSVINVATRQTVSRGDIIGYSGRSGYVTGPHLHFTVYDARTVQLRKSRVCGVLPYGGYLNPLDYF